MTILYIIIGLLLLTFGRKLFWLFVGLIGFVVGFNYAPSLFDVNSELALLIIALVTGAIGALLAVFLEAVAIAVGGFLAGGYAVATLMNILAGNAENGFYLAFIIGGILGAVFLLAVFDYALIIISSLAGSAMIIDVFQFSPTAAMIVFLTLFLLGVLIQTSMLKKSKHSSKY